MKKRVAVKNYNLKLFGEILTSEGTNTTFTMKRLNVSYSAME